MMIPIARHFILKCIEMFLKSPNEYMLELFKQEVARLHRKRKLIIENAPKVVPGQTKSVSDNISRQITNGPAAIAIDYVGKDFSKTPFNNQKKVSLINKESMLVGKKAASGIGKSPKDKSPFYADEPELADADNSKMSEVPLGSIEASIEHEAEGAV